MASVMNSMALSDILYIFLQSDIQVCIKCILVFYSLFHVNNSRLYLFVYLFGFYGISNFVGYIMPNPFLYQTILFQTVQFNISTQFNCQKHFYFKLFSLVKQFKFKQFSLVEEQFCLQTIKCQNNSIPNNSV